jgi:uncharacterized protein (DUF849 family)
MLLANTRSDRSHLTEFLMLIEAAINGRRTTSEHPKIPINPQQQAHQSALAVSAGAGAIHVHPRNSMGEESISPEDVGAALDAIRPACRTVPIGISTGAWIVPRTNARFELIERWNILPDFAGVNFHESGAVKTARLLLDKGVGVEAGIWNVEAANIFRQSGLSNRCLRILVEPAQEPGNAEERLKEIESALSGIECSRLLHGFETLTWSFIALASSLGYETRVGFEDTLTLPDGSPARDNGELVSAALDIISTCRPSD